MTIYDTTDEFYAIANKPVEYQRFVFYSGKIQTAYCKIEYIEKDGLFHYTDAIYEAKFGNVLFLKSKKLQGFTYDPKKKKVSVWFRQSIAMFNLGRFYTYKGYEWVIKENISKYITKGLFEKILSGKITNPYDACVYIAKSLRIKCSPELLRLSIKKGLDKCFILTAAYTAKDFNHWLELDFSYNTMASDLIKQASILNRKIDFKWSQSRMSEVHNQWTKEIMALELSFMENVNIDYISRPPLPKEFELIDTQKRLFEEGSNMHHCIYTNYLQQVLSRKYIVYHCSFKEPVTIGIQMGYANKPYIQQMNAIYNKMVSDESQAFILKHMNESFFNQLADNFKLEQTPAEELAENLPF